MVVLVALIFALCALPALAAQPLGYLAFGDLRGYLEPCGCDPATDLGGVHRLKEVVERERRAAPALLLFSLGNILPKKGEKELKNPFLLEAVEGVQPTAYLWNETEAAHLKAAEAFKGKLPFVLSNGKVTGPWREVIDHPAALILGYARTPSLMATTEPVSRALIERWKKHLAKAGDRPKVLLFAGSAADLEAVAKTNKLFDVVVSSNAAALDALPGTSEKDDEKKLERAPFGPVFQVPLGGQGILRGGTLMFDGAKSIGDLLGSKPSPQSPKPLLAAAKVVTWLPKSVGGEEQLKDLFARYNAAAKAQFAAAGAARLADLKDSPYAGADACASCHPAAQKVWNESRHAHAMATLQKKGKHEDPECVACHVVGATAKGGFVSMEHSPQLANVQCEVCHGPRKAHTQNPTIKGMGNAADVCASCHNPLHSPSFDAKAYWLRIAHGK